MRLYQEVGTLWAGGKAVLDGWLVVGALTHKI